MCRRRRQALLVGGTRSCPNVSICEVGHKGVGCDRKDVGSSHLFGANNGYKTNRDQGKRHWRVRVGDKADERGLSGQLFAGHTSLNIGGKKRGAIAQLQLSASGECQDSDDVVGIARSEVGGEQNDHRAVFAGRFGTGRFSDSANEIGLTGLCLPGQMEPTGGNVV